MSEQKTKPERIRTDAEILKEAIEEATRRGIDPKSKHPILDAFVAYAAAQGRLKRENEARKTPEQKAREAAARSAQWTQERADRERAKAEKTTHSLMKLYAKFLPLDAWKLQDEALPLLAGEEPSLVFIPSSYQEWLWPIAERSVQAGILRVLNPVASPGKWLVTPRDFHAWAVKKKLRVLPEFEAAFGLTPPTQQQSSVGRREPKTKTAAALEAKTRSKAKRRGRAKEFRAWIDAQSQAEGYHWRYNNIPDTKQSAHRVFYRLFPEIVKVTPVTLADDLHEVGIRFVPAGKSMTNNALEHLLKQFIKAK